MIITRELNSAALPAMALRILHTHCTHAHCTQDVIKPEMATLFISPSLSIMHEIQYELLSPEQLTCHHSMISSSNLYFKKRIRTHIHTWVNTRCSTFLTVILVWELIYILIESGSCSRKKIVTIAQTANSFTWKTACELQSHINIVFWIVNKIFIMLQIKIIWIAFSSCCLSLIFYWPSLLSYLMKFSFHNATRTRIFLNSASVLTYL